MNIHFDGIFFLKTLPAVIGLAGLLTFITSSRRQESRIEMINIINNVRNTFIIAGCAALILLSAWLLFRAPPPDHDEPLAITAPGDQVDRLG